MAIPVIGRLTRQGAFEFGTFIVNQKTPYMKNIIRPARILFGLPWIVVGIQHFMYADFVNTLVPAYMPFRLFWVYFTGTAMIAAGLSFIIGVKVRLASTLLGIMLTLFILQLHTVTLGTNGHSSLHWTRALQDLTITGAAFALAATRDPSIPAGRSRFIVAGTVDLITAARYLYAFPLIFLGAQHFMQESFVTGKIPAYLPFRTFWDYSMGSLIILAAGSILLQKKARLAALTLGAVLLLFAILLHLPLLVSNVRDPQEWTGAMLDLLIAAGAFIIADGLSLLGSQVFNRIGDGGFQRLETYRRQRHQYREDTPR